MGCKISEPLGYVAELEKPYEIDDEVPDAGHGAGALARAYLTAVLIEGDIPYPVQLILYLPVSSVEVKDTFRRIRNARNPVGHLLARRPALDAAGVTFYLEDAVWEIVIPLQFRARPDLACLEPSVHLADRGMLRGEKPPSGGPLYRP